MCRLLLQLRKFVWLLVKLQKKRCLCLSNKRHAKEEFKDLALIKKKIYIYIPWNYHLSCVTWVCHPTCPDMSRCWRSRGWRAGEGGGNTCATSFAITSSFKDKALKMVSQLTIKHTSKIQERCCQKTDIGE